jgi:hypothetical protein
MVKRNSMVRTLGLHLVGPLLGSVGHPLHQGVPHQWLTLCNAWILQSKQF